MRSASSPVTVSHSISGVVARGHAQAGVAVDDPRVARRDRDVGQQPGHQPRAHGRAMHGGHNGLAAIDDVVDQVAGFAPDAGAHVEVVRHLLHQVQVAAAGKALAFAADHHHPGVGVGVDIAPDIGQFAAE
ncbi:hypothetical protein G6F35_017340 [Rhizopus arrhizus]|nr:hypothetical protein G6F35_017340 [Rhizopus arrhizus]